MKKHTFGLLLIAVIFLLTACVFFEDAATHTDEPSLDYQSGYEEGYLDGYQAGIEEAKQQVPEIFSDKLYDLCDKIEAEWGISPEDAALLLSNYADVPDEVDIEDVPNAIWAIYDYYHQSRKLVFDISNYDID